MNKILIDLAIFLKKSVFDSELIPCILKYVMKAYLDIFKCLNSFTLLLTYR